ncbi:MAG: heterodisulfide reductase-related iron-sulfur binding cluster [Deltaproteobacteria bacterium]|nr:heterodisulfide reductase-related iron-sulfur binding cluster [Deltaproteobacteria bacterium]
MGVMLLLALGFFAYTMQHRLRLVLALRKENRFDKGAERADALVRFGFGQRRLVQRPDIRAGIAHVLIFFGFLVVSIRTITLVGKGFAIGFDLPLVGAEGALGVAYAWAKDIFSIGVLVGVSLVLYRRLILKSERSEPNLSREALGILAMISYLMLSDMALDGGWVSQKLVEAHTPLAASLAGVYANVGEGALAALNHFWFWTHVAVLLVFLNLLPVGKHFHVVTGLANVYFKKLGPKAKLTTLDLEDEENPYFGAAKLDDLGWKTLWDAYSCTECGRCLTHCPTYVTAKPLTLKGLNQTLKHHAYEVSEQLIGEKLWKPGKPLVTDKESRELPELNPSVIPDETVWACTTCGWCEQACPLFIEQVPRIVEMRRNLVMVESRFPQELTGTFKGMENQSNPWGVAAGDRDAWTKGLDFEIPRASEGGDFEYLFYVGCAGSFDDRAKKNTLAIAKILHEAGVKFAILGNEETCNGDQARRAGNEYLYQMMAMGLIETMNGYGVKKIVTGCPHCFNTIANEYPDLGGSYEVIHHSQLIEELLKDHRVKLDPRVHEGLSITYHDACYLGRHNDVYEAPRNTVVRATGAELTEMPRNRQEGFCCGAGGARMWMEEHIGERVNQNRVEEAKACGADLVATSCPFCQTMVKDGISELGYDEEMTTKDIAELVAEAMVVEKKAELPAATPSGAAAEPAVEPVAEASETPAEA